MMTENFNEKVWKVTKKIPRGKITTYKQIAKALNTKAYRSVGSALNKNPFSPKVPCHRVVNSNGNIGGFAKGFKQKIKMLKKEGIEIENKKIRNFEKKLFKF